MIENVWNWLVDWWERPSPSWMQRSSIWLFPFLALSLAFIVGGFWALIGPYVKGNRLSPGSGADTIGYAVLRVLAGGFIAAGALLIWWRKLRKP